MHSPDTLSLTIFLLVVAITALSLIAGYTWATPKPARKKAALFSCIALIIWMSATALFARSGLGLKEPIFLAIAPLMAINFLLAISIGLSPIGKRLATLPITALIAFHLFRLPLEWVLHAWADQGTVPKAMSWNGQNLDVITPIAALLILPFVKRMPKLVLLFEILGVLLLINLFRIVIQRTPGSPLWIESNQPDLLLAAYFPTVWIVTICVFAAILGHTVIARWLWINLKKAPPTQ